MIEGKIKVGDWFVDDDGKYTAVAVLASTGTGVLLIRFAGFDCGNRQEDPPVDVGDCRSISIKEFKKICGSAYKTIRRYRPEDQHILKDKLGEISMSKFKEGDSVNPTSWKNYFGIKNGRYSSLDAGDGPMTVICNCPYTDRVVVDNHNGGIWFFPEADLKLAEKRISIHFEGTEEEAINRFGKPVVDALKDCD